MGKWEVIGNAELCPNYFSVKVSVLAVVFYQQFSKIQQLQAKLLIFFKFVDEIQQLLRKRLQENNQDIILYYILLPICPLLFPKVCPIQK